MSLVCVMLNEGHLRNLTDLPDPSESLISSTKGGVSYSSPGMVLLLQNLADVTRKTAGEEHIQRNRQLA